MVLRRSTEEERRAALEERRRRERASRGRRVSGIGVQHRGDVSYVEPIPLEPTQFKQSPTINPSNLQYNERQDGIVSGSANDESTYFATRQLPTKFWSTFSSGALGSPTVVDWTDQIASIDSRGAIFMSFINLDAIGAYLISINQDQDPVEQTSFGVLIRTIRVRPGETLEGGGRFKGVKLFPAGALLNYNYRMIFSFL